MPVKSETIDYDAPVRLVNISFPQHTDAQILKAIEIFAIKNRFTLKISGVPNQLSNELIELFRTDIRMTGTLAADKHQLDIAVYRTYKWNVEQAAFDQGVYALRDEMLTLGKLEFNQIVLKLGDIDRNPNGYGNEKNAIIKVSDGRRKLVRDSLYKFAELNNFSVHILQHTPVSNDATVNLFRQGIKISLVSFSDVDEAFVSVYKLTGLQVSPEEVSRLFDDLKRRVEQIEGVNFQFKE